METEKSPAKPMSEILFKSPLSYTAKSPHKSLFSRTFGKYIPFHGGSDHHLHPPHLDYTDLLRLVDELRDRESRLKTELLEHKLLKQSLAMVPLLENEIYLKETELERAFIRIERLMFENRRMKRELREVRRMTDVIKAMEDEIVQLKKVESDRLNVKPSLDRDESADSQKVQRVMEVSVRSSLISQLKEDQELNGADIDRPDYSEEIANSVLSNPLSEPSTDPKSTKIPQFASSIASKLQSPPAPPPAVAVKPVSQPPPPLAESVPPPPPPPPPSSKETRSIRLKVKRVPELVEFYHSLMRRDSRKDCSSAVIGLPTGGSARDMIGEIENRSAYLLAIKVDVETKGEFIKRLIKEVENAKFTNIENIVTFVKRLDDELSYLVDERAVLKHFDWPERRADALREAAFSYSDLKKLALEASSFDDDRQPLPLNITLKNMQALLKKLEDGVYNFCRMRESATARYRVFQIPVDWMLDTGVVNQIKLQSLKLAVGYLKRVYAELDTAYIFSKEQLIIQGVRFAYRVHQFAGGFDMEAITVFQELKEKIRFCKGQEQKVVGCFTAD